MDNSDQLAMIDASLFDVMKVAKRPRYWDEFQKRTGAQIDHPTAAILRILSDQPLQFRDLVNRLGIEAPSISRKVHDLEQEGLIYRNPTEDRRIHILALSSQGRDLAHKILQARITMLDDALADWTASEKHQLNESLSRLASDLSNQYGSKEMKVTNG
jgi:DNA-binding MarR family transcriptional regulator